MPSRANRWRRVTRDAAMQLGSMAIRLPGYTWGLVQDTILTPQSSRMPAHVEDLADVGRYARLAKRSVAFVDFAEQREQHANTTDRAWLLVQYVGDETPTPVFAKTQARNVVTRHTLSLMGIYATEITAYSDLDLPIRRPHAHIVSASRSRFALVLDDLSSQGATFPSIWNTHVDRELGCKIVATLAQMHASHWGDKVPAWATRNQRQHRYAGPLGLATAPITRRACRPDLFTDDAYEAYRLALFHWAELQDFYSASEPRALCHGDAHLGNFYITADNEIGVLDFQVVTGAHPMRDIAYFLMCSYSPDDLGADEEDLIRFYLDQLQKFGVHAADVPTFADAWTQYRVWSWYALYAFTVSGGMGEIQDAYQTEVGVERILRAMERVDAVGALHEVLDGKLKPPVAKRG